MPRLRPFRAVRYAPTAGEPAALLSPPYDVIGPEELELLRSRSPHNAVWLDLPEGEGSERYSAAAHRLSRWLEDGVLLGETEPSAFAYRQTFSHDGRVFERRSLFAALRLEPLDGGAVLAHEETHGEPKRDRLALTLATRAQLSPVFLLAPDPGKDLAAGLAAVEEEAVLLDARTPDGLRHRLWRLPPGTAEEVCRAAGEEPLLIADGHHRYETALAAAEEVGTESSRWVLVCVASEGDPGLLLLPTHRSLRAGPPSGGWREALGPAFEVSAMPGVYDPAEAAVGLPEGSGELALLVPGVVGAFRLVPRPDALRGADLPPDAARIAALSFDRLILQKLIGRTAEEAAREGLLSYHRHAADALEEATGPIPGERGGRGDGAAFLLAPVRTADVRAAVSRVGRLPPKTTYFAPKVPTGIVFRRI